jgi:hypothetical protein
MRARRRLKAQVRALRLAEITALGRRAPAAFIDAFMCASKEPLTRTSHDRHPRLWRGTGTAPLSTARDEHHPRPLSRAENLAPARKASAGRDRESMEVLAIPTIVTRPFIPFAASALAGHLTS